MCGNESGPAKSLEAERYPSSNDWTEAGIRPPDFVWTGASVPQTAADTRAVLEQFGWTVNW